MASGGKNVYRAAWSYRPVRWLVASFLQSRIGDFMYSVALVAVVFDRTHSPIDVTIAAVAMRLPLVVLPPLAGLLVDRSDRRQLMLALDVGRCALMALIAVLIAAKSPLTVVVALAASVSALGTAYGPSEVALTASIVSEDDLGAINAVSASIESLALIAGPALGALVLIVGSPTAAVVVDAVTFAVSAVCLSKVARSPAPGRGAGRDGSSQLLAGFRALATDGGLAVVTLGLMACCIGVGSINVLFLVVSEKRLGTGTHGLGYLLAAAGVGGLIATLFANRVTGVRRMAAAVAVLLMISGVGLMLLAVFSSQATAYLSVAVWSGAYLLLEILSVTLLQRCVDPDLLGRATAAVDVLAYAGVLVGGAVTGPAAEHLGVRAAIVAVSAPSLVAAILIALRARALDAKASATEAVLAPRIAVLRASAVFAGVGASALESLASASSLEAVNAGSVVVRQGQPSDDLFVIVSGSFDVASSGGRAKRPTHVRTMGPGEVFGEIGLVNKRPRTATVTASSAGELYRIPGQEFVRVVEGGGPAFNALRDLAGDRLLRTHRTG